MSALKSILLSLLLLTVSSGVKAAGSTTVTLFDVKPTPDSGTLVNVTAIGVGANGGTTYVAVINFTGSTELVSPSTTIILPENFQETATIVEAASWLYQSIADPSGKFTGNFETNCTLGPEGTTGECVVIEQFTSGVITTTTEAAGPVVPIFTITESIPTPTSTSAATILRNPVFNGLSGVFLWIYFAGML